MFLNSLGCCWGTAGDAVVGLGVLLAQLVALSAAGAAAAVW